ncbi:MAG: LamG domain-containing protein [Kiritimatiellae bacterium]|jgi:hypothetical protein|nr:LamG domain-containing protein [Kiritimatiellia bacterium]
MKCINKLITMIISICLWGIASNLSAGTIAYWDFSSDSNGVTDVSGYYNTLVNNGVVISNGTAVFDGTHTAFSTANTLDLSGYSKLTVECFVRTTSPNVSMLIEHSENFNDNYGSFFLLSPDTGKLTASFNTQSTGYHSDYAPDGTLNDEEWHHAAWVYDSAITTTNRFRFYIDGVQQPQDVALTSTTPTLLLNRTLYIGSRANSSLKFTGEMDDLRISNHARPPSEFITERTEGEPPVIAHWRFDEGSGLVDSSGNGNTLTGNGVTFTDGIAFFDGNQSAFNTAANLNLSAYNNLTVECFIRTTSAGMVVEHSPNIGAANNANAGGFFLHMGDTTPGRIAGTIKTANSWHSDNSADGVMNDGQWHHAAWVYNSDIDNSYRYILYVDGVIQLQNPDAKSVTPTALRNDILYIGSRGNSSLQFTGEIDDLRITGRALTPIQFLKAPSTEMPEVIAYWPFPASAPLEDASGNGHSLTNAGVTFDNGAAVFDGTHTAFSTQPSTLNLHPYSALTVEYFIKTADSNYAIVMEHSSRFYDSSSRGGFVAVTNQDSPGQLKAGFSMIGTLYNIDESPANAVNDGLWHHVALVYDPETSGDDRVRLYLDSVQQVAGEDISDVGISFLNDILYIGSRADSELQLTGELDDVKITGAVLTPAEFMTERSGVIGTLILIQ